MKLIKFLSALCLLAFACVACNDKFDNPEKYAPARVDPSKVITIKALKAYRNLYPVNITVDSRSYAYRIENDVYIKGKVISSDRDGNLYKQLYIQDETGGIQLKIGKSGLYNFYKLGQWVYVRCRDLVLADYRKYGSLELGWAPNPNTTYATSFIDVPYLINKHIFAAEQDEPFAPTTVTLSELAGKPELLGTLIKIENLKFQKSDDFLGLHPDTDVPINLPLTDTIYTWAISAKDSTAVKYGMPADWALSMSQHFSAGGNQTIIVRTSGYARFAGNKIPRGTVNLTGILSVYGAPAYREYQLTLRDMNDVEVK